MADERIVPFRTGPGIFAGDGDTVSVLVPPVLEWQFVYDTEEQASHALTVLRDGLSLEEATAKKLRSEYSYDNLVGYVKAYLPRQGLIAFNRTACLRVDATNGVVEALCLSLPAFVAHSHRRNGSGRLGPEDAA